MTEENKALYSGSLCHIKDLWNEHRHHGMANTESISYKGPSAYLHG